MSPPIAPPAVSKSDEAPAETADDADALELCELFFAAGSAERRLILLNLDYSDWPPATPPAPLQRADIWRMETAALRHNTATVMRELERALGISYRQSRRIVEDELGEPIVVAAKAMSLPADVLQRILLFMNPRVGQSVDRVYELSALYARSAWRRRAGWLRSCAPRSLPPASSADTRAFARGRRDGAPCAVGKLARVPAPKRDPLPIAPAATAAAPLRRRATPRRCR